MNWRSNKSFMTSFVKFDKFLNIFVINLRNKSIVIT